MTLPTETRLPIIMQPQPDEATCGPTCLHALYQFYGGKDSLRAVIERTQSLDTGGTLAVFLACDALRRGYAATIYTYNLQVFDPTWFKPPGADLSERLRQQMQYKTQEKLQTACRGYLEFLALGGQLRFTDLTRRLIREYLGRSIPILTALSATYLYRSMREYGPKDTPDDIRGEPSGHFVILSGYNPAERTVLVSDPLLPNPFSDTHHYAIDVDRVICSVLLGILTYDANVLIIRPRSQAQ